MKRIDIYNMLTVNELSAEMRMLGLTGIDKTYTMRIVHLPCVEGIWGPSKQRSPLFFVLKNSQILFLAFLCGVVFPDDMPLLDRNLSEFLLLRQCS